ncbi:MAG: DNA phosphorothioation system sulfurtransferase DndC [Candidatus Heimdallarchaeota archaeon]|nr:DNA phosphorothioation system sulfurtransferase DndC [Candidatus Heimdallarchaeota archaeon]MCK4609612.1 DNA phosphorothioation system sulfurtransferase DndC [Candidatus Heimdallarchaeota archaeon]
MEISVERSMDPVGYAIQEIKNLYLSDERPWIIGYSGGKDSTTVVELVLMAIKELKPEERKKELHVISADTMVENPLVIPIINEFMEKVRKFAQANDLPIKVHILLPKIEETYWVLLIGQGYPVPLQNFRWCTDRLKIKPSSEFILSQVSKHGEVIIILGVRKDESLSRHISIMRSKVPDQLLRKHPTLTNAYVYGPIEDFTFDVVWDFLLDPKNTMSDFNQTLTSLYSGSSSEECVLVLEDDTRPCGNTRFGCWVCTLVKEDKSLKGFLETDYVSDEIKEVLEKLIDFRNWLLENRNNPDMRLKRRKHGQIYYLGEGENKRIGLGPYTLEARKEILTRLLKLQVEISNLNEKSINKELITEDELKAIRSIWINEGDWEDSLPLIFEKILDKQPSWGETEIPLFEKKDIKLLTELSIKYQLDLDVLKRLIAIENNNLGYAIRTNIMKEINKLLFQDWISLEEKSDIK